ncbi:SWI/SNF global transcription activator complex subunit Swp82p [Monosporozyma servazzii]
MLTSTPIIKLLTEELQNTHNLYLVRQTLQIISQEELISGLLDHNPRKQLNIPPEYFQDKVSDGDLDEFKFKQNDSAGDSKIDRNGKLLISGTGKDFLFNYFQLPGHGNKFWMLLDDLIRLVDDEHLDQNGFTNKYKQQILPIKATENEINFLKQNSLLDINFQGDDVKLVTTRSAYISFGAQLISQGTRILDDYWETLAKQQNFTTHHRVFKYSNKLIELIKQLKPQAFENHRKVEDTSEAGIESETFAFDIPYTIVTEQSSKEIREEYGKNFSQGQHIDAVIPGQSISGSLEFSAQFKVPKYHSKNSFLQATQIKGLDTPIGEHDYNKNDTAHTTSSLTGDSAQGTLETKHVNRMLSNIMGSNTGKEVEDKSILHTGNKPISSSLNIKGWKFDSLPVGNQAQLEKHDHSIRGLSYFEKEKLLKRLNYLTPNQIKETEHCHDCLFVNVGLQRVRKIRDTRWIKYWQYKNGLPMGLLNEENQIKYIKEKYLPEMLQHEEVTTTPNELTNTDEIKITKRVANANLFGHSNIKSFKPPYA